MKQSDVDALAAKHARNIKVFGLWLWLVILPVLGTIIYFGYLAPNYHPSPHVYPQPITCADMATEPDPLGAGGQIAPLCGNTPYPSGNGSLQCRLKSG